MTNQPLSQSNIQISLVLPAVTHRWKLERAPSFLKREPQSFYVRGECTGIVMEREPPQNSNRNFPARNANHADSNQLTASTCPVHFESVLPIAKSLLQSHISAK